MQKKLIALAVAGLASGAAFAQTNVTMYGIADAGYVYSTGGAPRGSTDPEFSGIQSGLLSGSRLGFRGEEALGNGLKAIFTLEYALNIDQNAGIGSGGSLQARQQFVGLAGNWGTVALGRQYAPGYDATVRNDAFGGAAFAPHSVLSAGAGNSITPNSGARWNNAVTFSSANYGGLTAKAIYAFGEFSPVNNQPKGADNIWDDGAFGLGANYANGPLNIDAVYQTRQYRRGAFVAGTVSPPVAGAYTYNGKDTNEWYVGGSFDLKFVKLMATYQDQSDKNSGNNDNTLWSVGAVFPIMSSSAIHLGYAQLDFDQGSGKKNGKTDSFGLAFTHGLSKRTTLYTGYVYVDNDKDSLGLSPAGTGIAGETNHSFVAGVRHSF